MTLHLKSKAALWWLAMLGYLSVLLVILAVLQYRWIGEISDAELERMKVNLQVASNQFSNDFDGEMTRLYGGFQLRNGFPTTAGPLIARYNTWAATAPFPQMVRSLYALKTFPDHSPELFKLE